ncbi:lysosomal-trafficking regulator [Crotalus adamanteus]|uniref:Lysosomal-trafficking regulator n=1 Tax=Crotalus adamanteus TaxID=8729 RepID=A0AAW1CBR9_CROAD
MESIQNIYVEDILLEMKEQLTKARIMETELVKPLFDSLLRVALGTYFTDLDCSEEKKEKIHQSEKEPVSRPDDISEEADESQCYCFKFFAEEKGYDADSESNSDENESKDEGTDIKREQGCFGYCSVPSDLAENIIQGELIYPELCMLELHLLSVGSPSLDVLTHVFYSFLKVVRLKEKNTTLLMQQGAVKSLLGGFLHVLTQTDSCFHECQKILVDLLVSLMSSSTSSEELTLLLRIFLEKTPAMGILLKGILKILEANTRMRPLQHIVFPLHQIPSLESSPCQKSAPTLSSKTVALLRRAKLVQSKKEPEVESLPHHLLSPWHVAPIHLPLVGQNCWPHMSEGFSISLWFSAECVHREGSSLEKGKRMKRRSKSLISHDNSFDEAEESKPGFDYLNLGDKLLEDGCLHIFSLGSKALMIQVWANVNSGAFTFRMCMDPNDEMKAGLLAQAETPENTFLVGKWQHLALTYIEQPENKKNIHGTLSLWICGQRKPDICLDYTLPRKMSLSSDCNKTFCMTGHYTSSQDDFLQLTGKWSLGNLLLFNGATIGPKEAFYLYAGGPDFTSVMPCKYGKSIPNYSKYIDKEILQCEQIKELLLSKKEVDTGPLIENLATVYTTCCPGYYTIYEPPAEYKGLQGILHEIGGIGSFVFLFARVVEISSCEETQALALKIILVLTKHNQQRIHELENCNGYSMIHQVLIKSKCIVGFHILQILLEGCCNEKMIHQDENGQFMLDMESTAIIQDVKLLEELLFDWKIWSKAQQGVWKTLLSALETLIQDNHWQQLFNIKQLLKARVVHHFLQTCQVLQEHKEEHFTSIPSDVCTSFVKIIEDVLGSPPDLELLRLIFNFLVAVHPATNTYVCHNPRDFYFSLHIDGNIFQEKVQSIKYMRNSSSGGKSVDSPVLARFSAVQQGNDSSEASNSQNTIHETPERLSNEWAPQKFESMPNRSTEDSLVLICHGLYHLLRRILLILPDVMLPDVLDKLVQPDILIVLVNHPSTLIQQGVIKLLNTYFSRATREQKEKFLKNRGFSLLANQLYLHQGTPELMECFLEMLFGRSVSLDEDFNLEDVKNAGLFQKWCVIPILGLIENSLHDCILLHNSFCFLLQIINSCSKMADMLLDNGLLYVLCNTLATLNGLEANILSNDSNHQAIFQKRKSIAAPRTFSIAQSETFLMLMHTIANEELDFMMLRRMSQDSSLCATEAELIQRLQRITVLTTNRFMYQDLSENCPEMIEIPFQNRSSISQLDKTEKEDEQKERTPGNTFLREMFKIMIEGIGLSIGTTRLSTPKQQWKKILLSCKDTFRVQLGRLLVHALSPTRSLQEQKHTLEFLHEINHQEILRDCLSTTLQHGPKLTLYLFELMHDHKDELTKEEQISVGALMNTLKLCGYKCIPLNAPPKPDLIKAMKEDHKKYVGEEEVNKASWEKIMANNWQTLFQRLDAKSKEISKIAGDITQAASLSQGMERKKVIQHIRGMYKTDLSASRHWQELIQQFTHDRALWYDPASYPTSWQLDPTEGPNRERRRLQRCYLTIPNKYLLKDRQKLEEILKPPLAYLFEDKTHSSHSSTVKDKAASEHIRVNRRCINVAPSRETPGELLLGKCGMYFVEDNASEIIENSSFQGETEPASFSWTFEEIKEVHKRWWQLRDNAVEIFLTNGRTLLLAFDNTKVRDDVYHNILTNNLPNLLEYGNITALTHLWYTGQITNFEYLTHLNKHAGRSFNDLMQYPVFPFILSDYTNETLDLNDPSVYRNLIKPIAVQSKEKEDRYVDTYKYLEEEYRKGAREDDPMPPVQPYHYGSHYSNSGTVLHFLVRMPPFTKMFLAYQDQSFDIPDRTFHSTNTTWRLSSYESMTDVKELIPEFFYLPEFLVNREGFDFGVRQNGERVNHVNLPPWARNDPRLFILIHRQALESDHVSQTICHWIDLVFGYKQKGKASVQAMNVFHPATYFGMDVSAVEDPVQRRALETMIKTYGQTPRQLFHSAHVSRSKLMEGELPAAMGLLVQFAFRETREHTKEIVYPSPLPWIRGLKWGEYVGSPSAPDPVVCFSQPHGERFGSLQALPTRAICGLSRKFCLLMIYSKEQGVRSMHSTDIQWSAILSWGYADNILRLKSKQSEPPVNFIQSSQFHQVTSCAWVPDSCQLFTGSKCGVITAYMNRFTSCTPSEIDMESQMHLYGHTAEITSLLVCKPYSIMISVSKDGTCIIWDLNRLCYVQSLAGHKSPVTAVSASETTGDIATVCDSVGGGSDLRLWTVNGDLVGHVHCREIICSVAFSNQSEGISINVIAGGLENGVVRLWSTWDLKPVREITFSKSNKPIVSLTFSCDGHHLYTANNEGTVISWCRKDQQRLKLPMFYSFLSNYAAG